MIELAVKDVARLLDVQEARLRYWAQTGFVGPSIRREGRFFYSFQDLIGVKAAKELLARGVPLQTVRKNLDALRAALPDSDLTALRVCSDGETIVVVADDDRAFEPTTGQLVMSFAVASLEGEAAKILPLPAGAADPAPTPITAAADPTTAYGAYRAALRSEERDRPGAERLYRRAVELDPTFAAAWTNLGALLERRGARGEARDCFERAIAHDPDQPEAQLNLANVLADLGDVEHAIAAYRRVIAACPELADAHYNLGMLLVARGALAEARPHLARYLTLDPGSEWATRAREV